MLDFFKKMRYLRKKVAMRDIIYIGFISLLAEAGVILPEYLIKSNTKAK